MKLLLINQDWFAEEFRAAGHEVLTVGMHFAHHLDVRLDVPLLHIDSVIKKHNFTPDRIIVYDNSMPIIYSGLDETDVPTLFVGVDTHHHFELHRYLYDIFDAMTISLSDYLPAFQEHDMHPHWLPLWASRYVEASEEKKYGAVFVGTLNASLNPERVKFFEELQKIVPVHCTTGQYWEIFPHAEIIMNQTVKGDLNFRVFEAMMCGGLLLTERTGNGLLNLFNDKEDLVTYSRNNVTEAAELINYYLNHTEEARHIARKGREKILSQHVPERRAEQLLDLLIPLRKRASKKKFFSMMINHAALAFTNKEVDQRSRLIALAASLKSAEYGVAAGEALTPEVVSYLILSSLQYDKLSRGDTGRMFLMKLNEAYPQEMGFILATIREKLNRGDVEGARSLASRFHGVNPETTFFHAEQFIRVLIDQVGLY